MWPGPMSSRSGTNARHAALERFADSSLSAGAISGGVACVADLDLYTTGDRAPPPKVSSVVRHPPTMVSPPCGVIGSKANEIDRLVGIHVWKTMRQIYDRENET